MSNKELPVGALNGMTTAEIEEWWAAFRILTTNSMLSHSAAVFNANCIIENLRSPQLRSK